jgi:hypothetical protein
MGVGGAPTPALLQGAAAQAQLYAGFLGGDPAHAHAHAVSGRDPRGQAGDVDSVEREVFGAQHAQLVRAEFGIYTYFPQNSTSCPSSLADPVYRRRMGQRPGFPAHRGDSGDSGPPPSTDLPVSLPLARLPLSLRAQWQAAAAGATLHVTSSSPAALADTLARILRQAPPLPLPVPVALLHALAPPESALAAALAAPGPAAEEALASIVRTHASTLLTSPRPSRALAVLQALGLPLPLALALVVVGGTRGGPRSVASTCRWVWRTLAEATGVRMALHKRIFKIRQLLQNDDAQPLKSLPVCPGAVPSSFTDLPGLVSVKSGAETAVRALGKWVVDLREGKATRRGFRSGYEVLAGTRPGAGGSARRKRPVKVRDAGDYLKAVGGKGRGRGGAVSSDDDDDDGTKKKAKAKKTRTKRKSAGAGGSAKKRKTAASAGEGVRVSFVPRVVGDGFDEFAEQAAGSLEREEDPASAADAAPDTKVEAGAPAGAGAAADGAPQTHAPTLPAAEQPDAVAELLCGVGAGGTDEEELDLDY